MTKKLFHWAADDSIPSESGVVTTMCGKRSKAFVYPEETPWSFGSEFDDAHKPCAVCLDIINERIAEDSGQ